MPKTEVYSWRVSPAVKARLEDAARRERRSVAAVLDAIVDDHLNARGRGHARDDEQQRQLHARAARFAGCLTGDAAGRSTRVREYVRARLRGRRGRVR